VVYGLLIHTSALYAHKFNTLFLHDIDNAEQFGFAKGQVTPFNIRTPDGQTLYAWHVLPLNVYAQHERALRNDGPYTGPVEDFEITRAFKLLRNSPDARVVISCALAPSFHA
jgi:abhydrolase domain-containing protein 12